MRAVFVGEAMLELSSAGGDAWRMGFGGDTLNTAIHLARGGVETGYLTALGRDPFSREVIGRLAAEGLDTSLILTHPSRSAGLYAISTDAAGERSFTYWRGESAARAMFDCEGAAAAVAQAGTAALLGFSLISLAILPLEGRNALLDLARRVRARGGQVAFDGNYRPRLWATPADARAARDAAIACATLGFPTFEDERLLSDAPDAGSVAAHWQALGCQETLVKLGEGGCRLPSGEISAPPRVLRPVDTSGAGDAFNGGYLGARLNGGTIAEAARAGHELAAWIIMRPGAIPARD